MSQCPICLIGDAEVQLDKSMVDDQIVTCPRCGRFRLSDHAYRSALNSAEKRPLVSGAIRNRSERGERVELRDSDLDRLLEGVKVPSDPFEAIDLLLHHLEEHGEGFGSPVQLNPQNDYPLLYSASPEAFKWIVRKAAELGYLQQPTYMGDGYRIDPQGWRRLGELKKQGGESDQAFVAMSFDPSLDEAWSRGLAPALRAGGLKPLRIDQKEHNEKICDLIIAEVRKSGLLVADFTQNRSGVYFEAGLAFGLGIPVIWTCEKSFFEEEGVHFDTRQYNHILWESPEDLKERLENRLKATVPRLTSMNGSRETRR